MSQPPPSPDQDRPPDRDQPSSWPAGNRPSIWPSGNEPPAWPSADQAPSWPSGNQAPSWPSGNQAPSWPSGNQAPSEPPGNEPPSWPSPGQPPPPPAWSSGGQPLPSPDFAYGYGRRPPRFRRRYPVRALIVLGLFVVFGFAVHGLAGHHKTVSGASSPSASGALRTGLQAPPGAVGASFSLGDGGGNDYRVTLVRVVDPARGANQSGAPDAGKRFVGLVFRIKALAGSLQGEDANNDAVLVGGNGQDYPADLDRIAGYTNFDDGAIHVAPGETVTGAVAFQVPDGVAVSRVRWTALSGFGPMAEWNVGG